MMLRGQGLGFTDAECAVHNVPGDVQFRSWNGECVSSDNYARLANQAAASAAASTPEGLRLAALTTGIQQGLWLSQRFLEWLKTLNTGLNAGQQQFLANAIAAAQTH